jgi:hypothetical protein
MRDGSTRKRPTSTQQPTWMPERVQVDRWRRHSRLAVLRELADGAHGLTLSRRLLNALLEELHISDDFDVLVGPVARLPASQYPRLLAIALLLRHSWCPQDLARTAARIALSVRPLKADLNLKSRDRKQRRRATASASPSGSRARSR